MKHVIEKDIPIPPRKYKETKWPFKDMVVGDSAWVELPSGAVSGRLHYYKAKGWQFVVRSETKNGIIGSRVWRTA